jgi:hypothetical protein
LSQKKIRGGQRIYKKPERSAACAEAAQQGVRQTNLGEIEEPRPSIEFTGTIHPLLGGNASLRGNPAKMAESKSPKIRSLRRYGGNLTRGLCRPHAFRGSFPRVLHFREHLENKTFVTVERFRPEMQLRPEQLAFHQHPLHLPLDDLMYLVATRCKSPAQAVQSCLRRC